MGNPFHHLQILKKNSCIRLPTCIDDSRKPLQVVKMDGNVIKLQEPLLVKELLVDFQGFGLKSSRNASVHLPPSFELKLGRTYYLFPTNIQLPERAESATEPRRTAAVRRIKVVITKKQLEELLAKKTSLEKLALAKDKACCSATSAANWKPNLTAIPEEIESITPM